MRGDVVQSETRVEREEAVCQTFWLEREVPEFVPRCVREIVWLACWKGTCSCRHGTITDGQLLLLSLRRSFECRAIRCCDHEVEKKMEESVKEAESSPGDLCNRHDGIVKCVSTDFTLSVEASGT